MRPEQVTTLANLEEQLVDVFTDECQPKVWPKMADAQQRGDRYWHKKNALATLTLVGRIQTVLRDARGDGTGSGEQGKPGEQRPAGERDDDSIEREAAALEKAGVALLRRNEKRRR